VFGELVPGEYVLVLFVGGHAHPPHPGGGVGDGFVIWFEVD